MGTEEMEELFDDAGLMPSHPDYTAPAAMAERGLGPDPRIGSEIAR